VGRQRAADLIVDTSALVAILLGETDWEALRHAINESSAVIPAPVVTELSLVTSGRLADFAEDARTLVQSFVQDGVEVAPFDYRHALLTQTARDRYGRGNGCGGTLNFGDLLVYAIAKDRGAPLLCTGRDFAATDLAIHPASRLDP
jgi:ribonuclease VapC